MSEGVYLFPGQGSQAVGMGRDLFDQSDLAKKIFRTADEILGYKLSELCFFGPEEELKLTQNTQPALLTVSYILFQLMNREPDIAAGHSLGEYSALLCAGSLTFEDAVLLVHKRGKYMQEAVPVGQGAMAALIGVSIDKVRGALAKAEGAVDVANWNGESQIVVSGAKEAVEKAVAAIAAPKAVFLPVSAPFHSRLMLPAEEKLGLDLDRIAFRDLHFPVVNNVDAREIRQGAEARDGLKRQVSRPVLWHATMEKMLKERKCTRLTEVGSGRVLSGLVKKCSRDWGVEVQIASVESWADLQKLQSQTGGERT